MSLEFIGDACAFIIAKPKNKYPRIGAAFKDSNDGRIAIKLDSLPLSDVAWDGWINIFPPKTGQERAKWNDPIKDDDCPF